MIVMGLDIETTGLDYDRGHRIIEVAASLYDLHSERLLGSFTQRVNPQRSIDPEAQRVHGISFDDVSGCPLWEVVGPKVSALMGKSGLIIAHNGDGFDLPFVVHELLRVGAPIPDVQSFDTMLHGRWATTMGKLPNLGELCFACGVEYDKNKAHAALYDVDVMMQSFFVGRRKGFFNVEEK